MSENFALIAEVLVNQHYASGPDEMKRVIAEALRQAASGKTEDSRNPREKLQAEVEDAVKASSLGSE
jgi:hypothetical protein